MRGNTGETVLGAYAVLPLSQSVIVTMRRAAMCEIENIEIARYDREIVEDLRHMLKHYHRILERGVSEVDESDGRAMPTTCHRFR